MDPVPPDKRTWTTFNYVAYWISDATNIATWEIASSMLAIGLSWFVVLLSALRNGLRLMYPPHRRQALPAIALGNTIMGIVMVLNGTIGARLHIAFPILNRSSFGFWLSYFSVISRVILSLFWFGVQTYIGSESVYQVLPIYLSSFP
jgi:NCS1 family nucleobase:cation symporter-1